MKRRTSRTTQRRSKSNRDRTWGGRGRAIWPVAWPWTGFGVKGQGPGTDPECPAAGAAR
ncbi:MAG: hypothetical protein MK101_08585 [Phycisphaerales bacterium]|nr:hypothetical protein [Phycisphaerales bacterium]